MGGKVVVDMPLFWECLGAILILAIVCPLVLLIACLLKAGAQVLQRSSTSDGIELMRIRREMDAETLEILSLDSVSAKARALAKLKTEERFICVRNHVVESVQCLRLAPLMAEVLTQYRSISTVSGSFVMSIDVCEIRDDGYSAIAGDEDVTNYYMGENEETVYCQSAFEELVSDYAPTVYHWVLLVDLFEYGI
jgi:hypothetical protein